MGAESREIYRLHVEEVVPPPEKVLRGQGIPSWVQPGERTSQLAHEALSVFRQSASPRAIIMEIPRAEFAGVVEGEGRNEMESPVKPIAWRSDSLALFAVTVGEEVSWRISSLFESRDFALASMLDAAASEGAEMAAQAIEEIYRQRLRDRWRFDRMHGTLRFSPGYCGWHITGQRALFRVLQPNEVGISLGESCIMKPIKSISGVIISGPKDIFEFEDVFSFCRECATHTCRERIEALREQ